MIDLVQLEDYLAGLFRDAKKKLASPDFLRRVIRESVIQVCAERPEMFTEEFDLPIARPSGRVELPDTADRFLEVQGIVDPDESGLVNVTRSLRFKSTEALTTDDACWRTVETDPEYFTWTPFNRRHIYVVGKTDANDSLRVVCKMPIEPIDHTAALTTEYPLPEELTRPLTTLCLERLYERTPTGTQKQALLQQQYFTTSNRLLNTHDATNPAVQR